MPHEEPCGQVRIPLGAGKGKADSTVHSIQSGFSVMSAFLSPLGRRALATPPGFQLLLNWSSRYGRFSALC